MKRTIRHIISQYSRKDILKYAGYGLLAGLMYFPWGAIAYGSFVIADMASKHKLPEKNDPELDKTVLRAHDALERRK